MNIRINEALRVLSTLGFRAYYMRDGQGNLIEVGAKCNLALTPRGQQLVAAIVRYVDEPR